MNNSNMVGLILIRLSKVNYRKLLSLKMVFHNSKKYRYHHIKEYQIIKQLNLNISNKNSQVIKK